MTSLKTHIWWLTSGGSAALSFITAAMPYLQFLAVVLSIFAAIKALRKK